MFARLIKTAAALALVFGLFAAGAAAALAATGPFLPGDTLFAVQRAAEQMWSSLAVDPDRHAAVVLDLADRRVRNLYVRRGTEYELVALAYFDAATDEAIGAVANAPAESTAQLRARLAALANDTLNVLETLTRLPTSNPDVYANARAKAEAIRLAANDPTSDLLQLASLNIGLPPEVGVDGAGLLDSPRAVPFPPHSTAAAHQFFPLTGKHAALACSSCHATGQYQGTPNQCADCHASAKPANHFSGGCVGCHSTMGWKPAMSDHIHATDCIKCHASDKPANHFEGQCADCHGTSAWKPAKFNHVGATDCAECHPNDKPANHFEGQCSNCHVTDSWKAAKMDHTGLADCLACHSAAAPVNHFAGQCGLCHSSVTWAGATFNHSASSRTDCSVCHTSGAPVNHFGSPCAACHRDTTNWRNAVFDHSFMAGRDCSGCHAGREPANHFGAPCSACHGNTTNWKNASFDHGRMGGRDCLPCHSPPPNHFPGSCRLCHSDTTNFRNATFSHPWFDIHHEGTNGACANCHPGNNYSATDCQTCHAASGEGGEGGDD